MEPQGSHPQAPRLRPGPGPIRRVAEPARPGPADRRGGEVGGPPPPPARRRRRPSAAAVPGSASFHPVSDRGEGPARKRFDAPSGGGPRDPGACACPQKKKMRANARKHSQSERFARASQSTLKEALPRLFNFLPLFFIWPYSGQGSKAPPGPPRSAVRGGTASTRLPRAHPGGRASASRALNALKSAAPKRRERRNRLNARRRAAPPRPF